jgi:peptidoglycan biosynthesis protein MviN/MurJ (putative lipid II flippase)
VLVGILGVAVYLATALALVGPWKVVGLATANAVQNSVHGIVLLALLQIRIGGVLGRDLVSYAGRCILAALGMGLALAGALAAFQRGAPAGTATLALGTAGMLALGVIVYGVMAEVLGLREGRMLVAQVRARLARPRRIG